MIKCNMGTLEVVGGQVTVLAEATFILSKVSEIMAKELGKTKKEVMKSLIKTVNQADKLEEGKL